MTPNNYEINVVISDSLNEPKLELERSNTELLQYLSRSQRAPITITINAPSRSQIEYQPDKRNFMKGKNAKACHSTMRTEILALHQPDCWKRVKRPESMHFMQIKFDLRCRCNQYSDIERYKVRMVVCENEEIENDNDLYSTLLHNTIVKLLSARWNKMNGL